jgi:hypothetical protein
MLKMLVAALIILNGQFAFAQFLKHDEMTNKKGDRLSFVHLFQITKDVNQNRVIYEAALLPSCEFNLEKPLKIYWIMGSGKFEHLNIFERHYFPISFVERTPHKILGEIKAIKDKKLQFTLTFTSSMVDGKCQVTTASPYLNQVISVRLSNFDGLTPKNISVQGLAIDGISKIDMPVQRNGVSLLQIENKNVVVGVDSGQLEPLAFSDGRAISTFEFLSRELDLSLGNLNPSCPVR